MNPSAGLETNDPPGQSRDVRCLPCPGDKEARAACERGGPAEPESDNFPVDRPAPYPTSAPKGMGVG